MSNRSDARRLAAIRQRIADMPIGTKTDQRTDTGQRAKIRIIGLPQPAADPYRHLIPGALCHCRHGLPYMLPCRRCKRTETAAAKYMALYLQRDVSS